MSFDFEQVVFTSRVESLRQEIQPPSDGPALAEQFAPCAMCAVIRSSSSRPSALAAIITAS
jgi:hypothetical protein